MGKLFLDHFLSQSSSLIFPFGKTLVNLNCFRFMTIMIIKVKQISAYSMSLISHTIKLVLYKDTYSKLKKIK